MAASPVPPSDGAEPVGRAASLTEWLRRRSDRELTRLLRLRPDLALPAPPDLVSLAGRLSVRTSVQRGVDALDARSLRTLENLVLAAGPENSVEQPDPEGLDDLFARALIWGEPDLVHVVPTVREAIGPYPAGLGRPAAALFALVPDLQLVPVLRRLGIAPSAQPRAGASVAALVGDRGWLDAQLAQLDDEEREVLDRLAAGPPVGTVRTTRPSADEPDLAAPHRLINRGLLVPIDSQRVELPREVGIALRTTAPDADRRQPPQVRLIEREPLELDRLGTTAVLEMLRLVDALAETWTAQPPPTLRSGGLGVRDLRRTAKDLGADEATTALLVETAYAAGLINATTGPEPVFLPTSDYDSWRARSVPQRWSALAAAWLGMTRQPSLVSQRGDRDRVISALSPDVERGTIPALRRRVLGQLRELPPGAAPAERGEVLALFAWHQPRRAAGQRPVVEAILGEADALGLTAAGGLTGYARTLLADAGATSVAVSSSPRSTAAAEHALDRALPEPVDHFLVQPDLTLVVPGPPEPALAVELGLVADLESTGGASVYRITERSVRRALDAGRTGDDLAAFVHARSRTPVPQALQYLIDDAARRHGVLRAGTAGAYLRCDDATLLARVVSDRAVASLDLRLIAPTVVISDAPVTRVLDVLRDAGFAPAAESPDGQLITLGVEPARAPNRPLPRAAVTRAAGDSDAHAADLVRRMRAADALAGQEHRVSPLAQTVPGVTSAATMEVLRRAVRDSRVVWFGCAEADGEETEHTLQPISLAAGMVRGYERGRSGLAAYPVHRITAIRVLDEDDEPADDPDSPA